MLITEMRIGLLKMERNRIMQAGSDISIGEVFLQFIAFLRANDVQVVHRTAPTRFMRCVHCRTASQPLIVYFGSPAALFIPGFQVRKLDLQYSSLKRIEASVIALNKMIILL